MLDGILTSALQIIIVLDICGAVFYVLMTGTVKRKEAQTSQHLPPQSGPATFGKGSFALSNQLQPAMAKAAAGTMQPPPVPEWVTEGDRSATDIYGLEGAETAPSQPTGLPARVSGIFASLKGKLTRQSTHENGETADLNKDLSRLDKVMDSFREEM